MTSEALCSIVEMLFCNDVKLRQWGDRRWMFVCDGSCTESEVLRSAVDFLFGTLEYLLLCSLLPLLEFFVHCSMHESGPKI